MALSPHSHGSALENIPLHNWSTVLKSLKISSWGLGSHWWCRVSFICPSRSYSVPQQADLQQLHQQVPLPSGYWLIGRISKKWRGRKRTSSESLLTWCGRLKMWQTLCYFSCWKVESDFPPCFHQDWPGWLAWTTQVELLQWSTSDIWGPLRLRHHTKPCSSHLLGSLGTLMLRALNCHVSPSTLRFPCWKKP